jgi:hypothetical protein
MLLYANSCSIAVQHMPGGGRLVRGPQAVLAASGGHPQSAVGSARADAGHQQEVSTLSLLLLHYCINPAAAFTEPEFPCSRYQ